MCIFVLAEIPILQCFEQNAKIKETQKRKNTLFVNTPVLTVLVKMSVFLAFFILGVCGISKFLRDVFER